MLCGSEQLPTSDEQLASLAQRGCTNSFEQLLRRFQTPVLQFLRRRGSFADAEDLTQEVFLRAYKNLHRYDQRWAFSAWLFTIARRLSINHRRRNQPVADSEAVESVVAATREPLEQMVAAEGHQRLWDLAATVLSEKQFTALWLHYVEDMPLRDIGLVLNCSRASVKIMLFRARQKLLPLLEKREEICLPPAVAASEVGDA